MKNIGINTPCSENFDGMTSTEKGAFCKKCATEVYDFTNKSNQEIKATLKRLIGKPVCGQISFSQENALNLEFEEWNFNSKRSMQSALIFTLVVVFGLTLFSCSDEKEKEAFVKIQQSALTSLGTINTKTENILASKSQDDLAESKQVVVLKDSDVKVLNQCRLDKHPGRVEKLLQDKISAKYINEASISRESRMLGAMISSVQYEEYLIQNVPEADPLIEIERDANGMEFPQEYSSKIYPNPVSSFATLELALPINETIEIDLFDLNGKHLHSINSSEIERGTTSFQVDMMDQVTGMYIIAIRSNSYNETIRVSKL